MNNKAIKAVISLSLVLILLFALTVPAFAAQKEQPTAEPRWVGILMMSVDMHFSGSTGTASGTSRKKSTASHIEGTLYVYKKVGSSWVEVGNTRGSKSVGTLALVVDFACETGVQYKAVLTVCAFTNGISEWETVDCLKTCP